MTDIYPNDALPQRLLPKPSANACLMIAFEADVPLSPKPQHQEQFDIEPSAYAKLPQVFTLTELPQPAVVAAECIEKYDEYLAAIPEEERATLDLNVADRWGDTDAVQRFMNRSLEIAFGGGHFRMMAGMEHIDIDGFYLSKPTYSYTIASPNGQILDFYSRPEGFEQPLSIQARINVTRPAVTAGV